MRELLAFAIVLVTIVIGGFVVLHERKLEQCPNLTIREYSEGR